MQVISGLVNQNMPAAELLKSLIIHQYGAHSSFRKLSFLISFELKRSTYHFYTSDPFYYVSLT